MKFSVITFLTLWLLFDFTPLHSQTKVDFDSLNWFLDNNATLTEYAGRKTLSGGSAYMKNIELLNGTIEVDFMTTGERNFGGIMFRVQSFEEYEWCWLRMHKTNGYIEDGIQYAPVFNGSACWQLNGGKGGIGKVYVPKNEWVHMKVEILNDTAKLYVKNMTTPALVMDNLQLGLKKGSIGLSSNFKGSVYFSDFKYKIDNSAPIFTKTQSVLPNIISKWQLSSQYKIKDFSEIGTYPENKLTEIGRWLMPDVEISGLINISKYLVRKEGNPDCAILKTYLVSDTDKIVRMNFGYSDAAAIFLNRQPIFLGNSAYRSRNEAYGGWISYNDAIYLNLNKGRNEVLVVVAEVFGGWGFQAKLEDIQSISMNIE
jgi:hypothetical protein